MVKKAFPKYLKIIREKLVIRLLIYNEQQFFFENINKYIEIIFINHFTI